MYQQKLNVISIGKHFKVLQPFKMKQNLSLQKVDSSHCSSWTCVFQRKQISLVMAHADSSSKSALPCPHSEFGKALVIQNFFAVLIPASPNRTFPARFVRRTLPFPSCPGQRPRSPLGMTPGMEPELPVPRHGQAFTLFLRFELPNLNAGGNPMRRDTLQRCFVWGRKELVAALSPWKTSEEEWRDPTALSMQKWVCQTWFPAGLYKTCASMAWWLPNPGTWLRAAAASCPA